jgi:hypothetical protein
LKKGEIDKEANKLYTGCNKFSFFYLGEDDKNHGELEIKDDIFLPREGCYFAIVPRDE